MPLYNTKNPPPFLGLGYPTNHERVFNLEALVSGQFSQQVSVPIGPAGGAKGIRVEGDFSADPGTFEIDIMEASTDDNGAVNYQQVPTGGAITTVVTGVNGASTHFGVDLQPFAGDFALLYIKTKPSNVCTLKARIVRTA